MAVEFRPFGADEQEAVARVFAATLNMLLTEAGGDPYVDLDDEAAWTRSWNEDRRSLFEHVDATKCQSWLAEEDGRIIGYARSILRDGMCQLTEFFILPGRQSAGIGRELIARAFDAVEADRRTIIATTRAQAMARYLKSGVYPICPLVDFEKAPEPVEVETDLAAEEMTADPATLAILDRIDQAVLGYRRTEDHRWLLTDRTGFLFRRNGEPAGYGYISNWGGPYAALDPADFPAILAHAETATAAAGHDCFYVMVPMLHRTAIDYLLSRGFRFDDGFMMLFMADGFEPKLDRYCCAMPGFFT